MTVKFVNFFKSLIADVGGIGAEDTEMTLSVGDGNDLPTLTGGHHCYLTIVDSYANREVVKVTGVDSDTCTIERGQDGTTPRMFSQNDIVELRLTRGALEDILEQDEDLAADISTLEDIIEAITNCTVGVDDPADFKVDALSSYPVVSNGLNDGTQNIAFPTNNMSACKFMTGDSNTILWMYLNTAPPGWKVSTTGADRVLGIAGGSLSYNVDGGNLAGSWTLPNHTLIINEIPSHTHGIRLRGDHGSIDYKGNHRLPVEGYSYNAYVMQPVGGGAAHNHGSTFRPAAAVGKLFQLDAE
jgi:hypothetical protein